MFSYQYTSQHQQYGEELYEHWFKVTVFIF